MRKCAQHFEEPSNLYLKLHFASLTNDRKLIILFGNSSIPLLSSQFLKFS